jgi:hypothetical protein
MTRALNLVPTPQAVGLWHLIEQGWVADTSAADNWSYDRPEAGHCAVTALIVQDILGGELRRALVNGESHYWNRLEDGTIIDLTRSQFDAPLVIEDEVGRDRDYVLSNARTKHRYELLRWRLRDILKGYTLLGENA